MFAMSTAEKAETIVLSFLANGTKNGSFGNISDIKSGLYTYQLEVDDKVFLVRCSKLNWIVKFGDIVSEYSDLCSAFREALSA